MNLDKALDFANYRTTLNNQHEVLKTKLESSLSVSINGGTFTINRELISFMSVYQDLKSVVLLDIYNNPILISEPDKFLKDIKNKYIEVTSNYYTEYEKLRKARTIHKIIDLDE